jgi:undecaprenyl-diphosphatase
MLDYLNQIDRAILVFFNQQYSPFWDELMLLITGKYIWIPLYVVLIGLLIYKLKKTSWIAILTLVLTITVADQFASSFCKPTFKRLRPCHDDAIKSQLHIIKPAGSQYGFISSHAANTFALATFIFMAFKSDQKWIGYTLFIWAAMVSLSRVYLGVHYPGDVLAGGVTGIVWGWCFWKIYQKSSAYWLKNNQN